MRLAINLKQTQKLILSPQMQQAIKILQLPLMELRADIQQELATNPLLEEQLDSESNHQLLTDQEKHKENDTQKEIDFKEEFDKLSKLDEEWKEYFRQTGFHRKNNAQNEEQRKYFEDSITIHESLQEHLLKQLSVAANSDKMKKLGEIIIGNINDNGYLQGTDEEIAKTANASLDEVEEGVDLIQKFHPVGVGARNLKECLFIQLMRLDQLDSFAAKIVNNHLDALGKKKYPQIAKLLKISVDEVQIAADIIAGLEPKPGRMFSEDRTHYIIPDIAIEKIDGQYQVILNNDRIPRLKISNLYKNIMNNNSTSETTKNYIKEKVKSGMWFIKNIHQRQETTYNIVTVIAEVQKEFLDKGIAFLKPLTMNIVANKIGVHESTVSRALANKYVQTPQGIFELKFFFTSKLKTSSGESVSSTNIKNEINNIIKNENHKSPLSDQQIIEILDKKGVQLARRTVAKYRKELNILPSNLRRKF